ncbi:MAG: hypothetical protein AAGD35_09700 [Actinomycetota bacterium]
MKIIAALFMDDIQLRPVPGPSTRIDLTGIQFSAPAPSAVPVTVAPHLVVLVWNPPDGKQTAALEVVFTAGHELEADGDVKPLARNVQPLDIQPGLFNYRLVRPELSFDDYGPILARCRIDNGPEHLVPYTLLGPVE